MVTRSNNSLDAVRQASGLDVYSHVDYRYYKPEWDDIRDAIAGERRVKERGTAHLPALDVEYGTSYEVYKERAVFVNMVSRTVMGLVGTIFRRQLKAENVSKEDQKNVTLNGLDLNLFAKKLAFEVCSVGRVGVLVDMVQEKPYLTEYVAENILSWRTRTVNGREVLDYVLLREITDETPILDGTPVSSNGDYVGGLSARYRVLILDNGVYKQRVYTVKGSETNPSFSGRAYTEVTPTRNGKPFEFIPMIIIGPLSPTPEVQKSPVYDICTLNYAHYRTSAQLEHGRYYTALPVYYVPVQPGQEENTYHVGPSVVWEVPADTKPGVLEYYGTGLKSLTDSLIEKEEHIAQLGGRIMGIRPAATAESDNIFKMKQANEMSILLNITESLSLGLTTAFKWYLDWQRKSSKDVRIVLNQDFKSLAIAARELRAVALLYQQGILPIDEVFKILQDAEFINDELTLAEFREMLDNLDNFPNQPDVAAMHEGYPDAASKLLDGTNRRKESLDAMQSDADRAHAKLIEQRRQDQQFNLQDEMFKQNTRTSQFEAQQAKELETLKAELKAKLPPAQAPVKPKASGKPAAKKKK
ncbi:MAG: DUF4055 domain-containing protein [Betaproteobacteria bacterium]